MSDQPQSLTAEEVMAAVDASADVLGEEKEMRPGSDDARAQSTPVERTEDDEDEQLSAIEQSAISLHNQSSARSLSAAEHPSRPSTASALRPASALSLPIDPRFPSDPSPQLLVVLHAADDADRLTASSRSPLPTERSAAADRAQLRPESATQLGGVDTLQGLPSHAADYALSVMQSKMRWRESTRAERAARVERRKEELLAEFAAEASGTPNSLAATKLPTATRTKDKAAKTSAVEQPLSAAIAVS